MYAPHEVAVFKDPEATEYANPVDKEDGFKVAQPVIAPAVGASPECISSLKISAPIETTAECGDEDAAKNDETVVLHMCYKDDTAIVGVPPSYEACKSLAREIFGDENDSMADFELRMMYFDTNKRVVWPIVHPSAYKRAVVKAGTLSPVTIRVKFEGKVEIWGQESDGKEWAMLGTESESEQ